MRISKVFFPAVLAVSLLIGATSAFASTVDFESTALGEYSSLAFADFQIKSVAGTFVVVDQTPGPPVSHHSIINFAGQCAGCASSHFLVTALTPFNYFQVGGGDFNADDDPIHLRAYDSLNNLIGSDDNLIPLSTFGGLYLSVLTAGPIDHVEFWSDGAFPESLYWDNITAADRGLDAAVPEPTSLCTIAGGLAALAGLRKRFNRA